MLLLALRPSRPYVPSPNTQYSAFSNRISRRRNTTSQIPKQPVHKAATGISGKTSQMPTNSDSPRAQHAIMDQYQHFIPRFILRRFKVGFAESNSKAEKIKVSRRPSVGSLYVHYYDVATCILDIRPIGKVYGIPNFYRDVRNTENINDLEVKLAYLEGQAAIIIMKLHKGLHHSTFTLKRGHLNLLRKFLFVMHYRNTSCSSAYFQADHPENARARQWIECFMKVHDIQSPVETWLHFLRYYLDTPHCDIMRDGMALVEKYGVKGLREMLTKSHIPPDLENYPAFTYLCQAGGYFLSIWEAAEGEEFILTHNAFGLWEGLAGDRPGLHRIFVIGPRVALVLCSGLLRPEHIGSINQSLFRSSLLGVDPVPATPIYVSGVDSIPIIDSVESAKAYCHSKSSPEAANDSFVFPIIKLSRYQTLELNFVLLDNVKETGSLTFLSREIMLSTARAFRSSRINLPESDLLVPLIENLTATGCTAGDPSPP